MPSLNFALHAYQARSPKLSAQRVVNYFAESAPPDSKSLVAMLNAPGIKAFADGLGGALRGAHEMGGVAYAVAGNAFFSVDSAGTATNLGAINTNVGNVSMDSNRASPLELVFVDGTDGWTYDTVNGLREITDADFEPADTVTFQDGYFVFSVAGTSKFRISAIDDGRSYASTDFGNAEADSDNLVVVRSSQQQLWLFGERTTEIYYNSGNADFPFERISGAVLDRGCAAAFSVAEDDNTLFWLGDDRIVYRANGFTPQRISTHAIEEALRTMTSVSDATAFFVTISGHKFYHLTLPTGQKTFVYDVATGLWHERESFGQKYWRGSVFIEAYGKQLVGDAFQGRIGELDLDTFTEFGETMQGVLTGPPLHRDRRRIFHRRFEVDIESGKGLTAGQGSDPQVWMDYSDDGANTWSSRKPFRSMGKIGAYRQRLRWLRLGQSRDRVYRLTVSDPVKRSIIAAHADMNVGN